MLKRKNHRHQTALSGLVIVNDGGKTVYELKAKGAKSAGGSKGKTAGENSNQGKAAQQIPQKEGTGKTKKDFAALSKEQMDSLQAELYRTGVTMETVQNRYQIQEPGAMSAELYGRVMSALKRTKSTEAA